MGSTYRIIGKRLFFSSSLLSSFRSLGGFSLFSDLGKQIRVIRKQRNFGLNELADRLDVSRGYLSNLETGKTSTINLDLLDRIQSEFQLYPIENDSHTHNSEMNNRLHRLILLLKKVHETDPQFADYLITTAEQGASLLSSKNK